MEFRKVAATWLVAQCEPLVPALDRAVVEQAFVLEVTESPGRAAWWFGGLIADHMLTLPAEDPWRSLSARAGHALTRGPQLPKPPETTGAVGAHGAFGVLEDCTDLAHPSFTDTGTDVGLAAVASGITPAGGALVAFGADGWQACAEAALSIHEEMLESTRDAQVAAARFFGACSDAARWALWRRRAYVGLGDDWTLVSGFAWLWRAQELATAGGLSDSERAAAAEAVQQERIDDGTYKAVTGS